jgi:hypothetical protein
MSVLSNDTQNHCRNLSELGIISASRKFEPKFRPPVTWYSETVLKRVSDGKTSIVIVEHVIRIVRECCRQLTVLHIGAKFAEGPTLTRQVRQLDDIHRNAPRSLRLDTL